MGMPADSFKKLPDKEEHLRENVLFRECAIKYVVKEELFRNEVVKRHYAINASFVNDLEK